jgi:predicted porin
MGGFTAIVGYVPNEGKNFEGQTGSQNPSAWDLGLKYANGPILAFLSHADVKVRNSNTPAAATDDAHAQDTRLGGSYNFGAADVRLFLEQTKLDVHGGDFKQSVWGVGATFSVTPAGKIVTQYYKANDVKGSLGAADTGAKLFELGYEHSLSKRTMLKATYARVSNDTNGNYDFGINASGAGQAGFLTTATGYDVSGLSVGIRHKF